MIAAASRLDPGEPVGRAEVPRRDVEQGDQARGQRSPRGTRRLCPARRTRARSPPPPTRRQTVRNVHGSSSRSASFMAGQLLPHRTVSAPRRRSPPSGRWLNAVDSARGDRPVQSATRRRRSRPGSLNGRSGRRRPSTRVSAFRARSTSVIASTSYTQPPQVPPPTAWSAAQSAGRPAGGRDRARGRAAGAAPPAPGRLPPGPTPGRRGRPGRSSPRAGCGRSRSGSGRRRRTLPIGPPASASGADVADARARRDAREARVGEHGDVLAERQVLQRGRDLVDLLHARAQRPAADQHQDVARLDALRPRALDRRDRRALGREDARRARSSGRRRRRRPRSDRWRCS